MKDIAASISRAKFLPLCTAKRQQATRQKFLPKALYGVETRPPNRRALAHLQSVIADFVGPNNTKRSLNMTFAEAAMHGHELDPHVCIMRRRINSLRRLHYKKPHMRHIVQDIIRNYQAKNYEGTHREGLASTTPLPPLNDPTYHLHRPKSNPLGPIGLALHTLFHFGATMDTDLWIHSEGELPLDVIGLPHKC